MRMLKLFEIVFHHINFRDISTTNPQGRPAYLWGILGQWDILLFNLTSIGFTIFFRCLIFDLSFFTNADVVTIKNETSEKNL